MGKDQELLEAARNGNIAIVEKLLIQKSKRSGLASLRRGPGANAQDSSGYSALHHASLLGHTDIVQVLLAYDASANLQDSHGSTPLHLAAWGGHQRIVEMLVSHAHRPANANAQTKDQQTPLHCAAQHGHTGALTTLLKYGADPSIVNKHQETPLDLAAQYGRLHAVQMLLRAHPELLHPYRCAAGFVDDRDDVRQTHTPLHLASRNGHQNVVEHLLAAGVNVNLLTENGSALHEAAMCGKNGVVQTLLEAGVDLGLTDGSGRTALDLLQQFPAKVTRDTRMVIDNHRNSMAVESDSDASTADNDRDRHRMVLGSSYESNTMRAHGNDAGYWHRQADCASPSSSMGSFDPSTPSPRPRAATAGETPGYYLSMAPIDSKVSPTPPKKPPRRNLSVSPTHLMSTSMDGAQLQRHHQHQHHAGGANNVYEHAYFSRSGSGTSVGGSSSASRHGAASNGNGAGHPHAGRSYGNSDSELSGNGGKMRAFSADQYVRMGSTKSASSSPAYGDGSGAFPQPAPRTLLPKSGGAYENVEPRSYNPNRKLRRNRENYADIRMDRAKITPVPDTAAAHAPAVQPITPLSPTHYVQPPTPEHPPPNALQAERCIQERIRPLSQEYKRRSALLQLIQHQQQQQPNNSNDDDRRDQKGSAYTNSKRAMIDTSPSCSVASSAMHPHSNATRMDRQQMSSLGASSGSLSSSVSLSDRSASTDCVEEFVGDAPFAGLFKGSTMALNVNPNTTNNAYLGNQAPAVMTTFGAVQRRAERPTTLFAVPMAAQPDHTAKKPTAERSRPTDETDGHSVRVSATNLSPFDEQEEWAKISEIMATFGTDAVQDSAFATDEERRRAHQATIARRAKLRMRLCDASGGDVLSVASDANGEPTLTFAEWLTGSNVAHLESVLQRNGFDDLEFLNGILERSDLLALDVSPGDADVVMAAVAHLKPVKPPLCAPDNKPQNGHSDSEKSEMTDEVGDKTPPKADEQPKADDTIDEVADWLSDIHLQEYADVFRRHLYTDMARVRQVWEVELQAVLEIVKPGHRKRILHSIAGVTASSGAKPPADAAPAAPVPMKPVQKASNGTVPRTNHGKNRMAPQPPGRPQPPPPPPAIASNLEIRTPAELLLGVPVGLQASWRHMPADLLAGQIQYEVNYLGSTLVKELRGTESTRKSIQKLKRSGELRLEASASGRPVPNATRRPLKLSISHRGVQFIDIASQGTICEHEIRNIDCACQDSDDLSHFAYITKDSNVNAHYCHVFNVDSMDLATTIIMTLGQAFEVAYQLALRESAAAVSATTPLRSPHASVAAMFAAATNGNGHQNGTGSANASNGIKLLH